MTSISLTSNETQAAAQTAARHGHPNKAERRQKSGTSAQVDRAPRAKPNKTQTVITLLRRKKGASIDELATATGWQPHSVRGLISGTIKKKMYFNVVAGKDENSETRYRIFTCKGAK